MSLRDKMKKLYKVELERNNIFKITILNIKYTSKDYYNIEFTYNFKIMADRVYFNMINKIFFNCGEN